MTNKNKIVITCWDGDIYILTGYESSDQVEEAIAGMEKVIMPNGDLIARSAISKIQTYSSYLFQQDQKARHKKGQHIYISEKTGSANWYDQVGEVDRADIKSITGEIKNIRLESSTGGTLTDGSRRT